MEVDTIFLNAVIKIEISPVCFASRCVRICIDWFIFVLLLTIIYAWDR